MNFIKIIISDMPVDPKWLVVLPQNPDHTHDQWEIDDLEILSGDIYVITSRAGIYRFHGPNTNYLVVYKPNVTCETEIWDIIDNYQNVIVTDIIGVGDAIETMQRRYL